MTADLGAVVLAVDGGVAVSAIAVVVTVVLWLLERRARRAEAAEERKLREALGERQEEAERERLAMLDRYHAGNLRVQERLTELLTEQADLRREMTTSAAPAIGPPDVAVMLGRTANLDAELVDGNVGPLVIRNNGPGHARLLDVQTLGDPSALVGGQDFSDGYELPAESSLKMTVALSMATPSPLLVRLTWQDSNGVHTRDVRV